MSISNVEILIYSFLPPLKSYIYSKILLFIECKSGNRTKFAKEN